MSDAKSHVPGSRHEKDECLAGKRAAVILYSCFPSDPRPRREAEALAAKGMEVDLICLRDCGNQKDCNKCRGINVLHVPLRRRREGKLTYLFQYLLFTVWAFAIVSVRSIQRGYWCDEMLDLYVKSGRWATVMPTPWTESSCPFCSIKNRLPFSGSRDRLGIKITQ